MNLARCDVSAARAWLVVKIRYRPIASEKVPPIVKSVLEKFPMVMMLIAERLLSLSMK